VLMRPLSSDDRATIIEWINGFLNKTENQALDTDEIELASALTATVLVSSVYFHLR